MGVHGIVRIDGRPYSLANGGIISEVDSSYMEIHARLVPGVDFSDNPFSVVSKLTIKNVIFNDPATIVMWGDGSKSVVKCQDGDTYSKELGLAMCIAKKCLGNQGNFNEVFKKWIPELVPDISVETMRDRLNKYCHENGRLCRECPLYENRCGRGVHFCTKDFFGNYKMTDEEIGNAFNIVFGK